MYTTKMQCFRMLALAVLLVLFTINLLGIYLGFILNRTILQPTFLVKILKSQGAYAQVRQLMFRMVNKSLPNGQDSIPYLDKAISEDWLEENINNLLDNFYVFAKGRRSDTPTIPFHDLKKQVVDILDDSRSYQDRTRLVQFWFDPLPDEVNLEDFMSVDLLWGVRNAITFMTWFPWIICATCLVIILLMYLTLADWKQLLLWISAGLITTGLLLVSIDLMALWIVQRMSIVMNITDRISAYGIPRTSMNNFFTTLLSGITSPMNISGIISILVGGILGYLVPIDERVLTLIK